MRLYIAGPMTGIEDLNFPAFSEAQRRLLDCGYEVENPAMNGAGDHPWDYYVRMGLQQLLVCEGIALLEGWKKSRGAVLERHVARGLDMPVHTVEGWIALAPGTCGS